MEDYSLLKFIPLDKSDDESVQMVLSNIDHCMQYGEDLDVRVPNVCMFIIKG